TARTARTTRTKRRRSQLFSCPCRPCSPLCLHPAAEHPAREQPASAGQGGEPDHVLLFFGQQGAFGESGREGLDLRRGFRRGQDAVELGTAEREPVIVR